MTLGKEKPTSAGVLLARLRDTLCPSSRDSADPIHGAGVASLAILPTCPAAVRRLAYKKLHVHPFKDVPLCWRRAYEEACLWELTKALEAALQKTDNVANVNHVAEECNAGPLEKWANDAVRLCDRAIIFTGAPKRRQEIDEVLRRIEQVPARGVGSLIARDATIDTDSMLQADNVRPSKRRRVAGNGDTPLQQIFAERDERSTVAIPTTFPTSGQEAVPLLKSEYEILRLSCPSLSEFQKHMMESATPLVLTGTIDHWPAYERWQNPKYWDRITLHGRRLVPVELGKSYTDEGWGQKIMPFRDFMFDHLLHDHRTDGSPNRTSESSKSVKNDERSTPGDADQADILSLADQERTVGYLAQHDLLAQIPSLRNDVAIPDYCYVDTPESVAASRGTNKDEPDETTHLACSVTDDDDLPTAPEPMLNIWLGPANTVSPAHTDPHHNILAQVFGRKYVRLFAPSETEMMYPMGKGGHKDEESNYNENHSIDMGNTSRIDVGVFIQLGGPEDDARSEVFEGRLFDARQTERQKFPRHESARFVEAILEPGECLYIPRGWWHYVRSLEPSCNVSFWWD